MLRTSGVLMAVALLALAPTAGAQEPQRILGLTLGSSVPDPSDPVGLNAAFGGEISQSMTGLLIADHPAPHYQIELRDHRRLSLWFDEEAPDRPIYWISLIAKQDPLGGYKAIENEIGNLDYKIAGRMGAPLGVALVQIDPALPAARQAAIRSHIGNVLATRPDPSSPEDPFIELPTTIPGWVAILGDQFRGEVVGIYTISNQIDGVQTELIDTAIAMKVLVRE